MVLGGNFSMLENKTALNEDWKVKTVCAVFEIYHHEAEKRLGQM